MNAKALFNLIAKITLFIVFQIAVPCFAQNVADSAKLDYNVIYGYGIQGNVKPILAILQTDSGKKMSKKDVLFKKSFEDRFKYSTDNSKYLDERHSPIDTLVKFYRDYWRMSFKNSTKNYDSLIIKNVSGYLVGKHLMPDNIKKFDEDTINTYLKKYLSSLNLYTTGFSRTGNLLDLYVWKKEEDTVYTFKVQNETIRVPVVFMNNFISQGATYYSTLGAHYAGGWTTENAIYCVKKAYDLKSEDFLIDFLAHEGQHFADYKLWPQLKPADLEYRAKLAQLILHKQTVYELIKFFINEADHSNHANAHPFASYCLINNLSKALFKVEFEKDIHKWEIIPFKKIHKTAETLLQQNTTALNAAGAKVERYIN